jgi:hypothetical protein
MTLTRQWRTDVRRPECWKKKLQKGQEQRRHVMCQSCGVPFLVPLSNPCTLATLPQQRTSIHQVQASFPHAKCTADLPLSAACHFLSRYGANQGSSICKKSGQPQFRSSWHRGTSAGRFPSPSQGKLCSCLV